MKIRPLFKSVLNKSRFCSDRPCRGSLTNQHPDKKQAQKICDPPQQLACGRRSTCPGGEAVVNPASAIEFNLRFAGQYFDEETGFHYNYHRYYDPATGRYLTADPIGLAGGIHLYTYVQNDPVDLIDPHGLSHIGFLRKIAKMADKSLRKTLKSLEKNIAEHEEALKDPVQKLAQKHHEHELRVFKEQHRLALEEADKRGLIAVLPFIVSLLDSFDAISGELANPEEDADGNGIPDYLEQNTDLCE